MKIIKNGNTENLSKTRIFTCDRCSCVFEAESGEYKTGSQYNEYFYYCNCPNCTHTTFKSRLKDGCK